jgi:cell surface protein SprA
VEEITLFNQTIIFSYTLPTEKFPLVDWTKVNLQYQASYRWIGASRLAVELGNILENGQSQEATVQFDLTRLYSKFRFFRAIEVPRVEGQTKEKNVRKDSIFRTILKMVLPLKSLKRIKTVRINDPNYLPDVGTVAPHISGKLITSVKQGEYLLVRKCKHTLPGYMDSTQFLGRNFRSMPPDFGFILGQQPDTNWLNNAAQKGLITTDSTFNTILQQSFDQRLTFTAQSGAGEGFLPSV